MKIDGLFWFPVEQLDEIVRALYEIHGSPLDLAEALADYAAARGYSLCNGGDYRKKLPEGQQIRIDLPFGEKIVFHLEPPNFVFQDTRKGTVTLADIVLRGISSSRPVDKKALPGFLVKLSIDSGWVQKNFKRNGKRDWLADLGIW
jgi:hypothetical protein